MSLHDDGITNEAEETGLTFEQNARIKAQYYWWESRACRPWRTTPASRLTRWTADPACTPDATPGDTPRTRRTTQSCWASWHGLPADRRTGRYQCVLVLVEDGEVVEQTEGTFEGRVADAPRGDGGFGYDPIFEPLTEAARRPHGWSDAGRGEESGFAPRPCSRMQCASS